MDVGIYIIVRRGSTRLRDKALKKVNDLYIIEYLIERLVHKCSNKADIVICTTVLEEDKVFEFIAKKYNIMFFQGDVNNVLKRQLDCANYYHHDYIVNVDGDDIFCNPEYVAKIIDVIKCDNCFDIVLTDGLPFGTNSMVYKKSVLERVFNSYKIENSDTGWGEFLKDEKMFVIHKLKAVEDDILDDARLTLDYEEDYQLFKIVIENVFKDREYVPQKEIIEFLKNHPEIVQINNHLNDMFWENYNSKKMSKNSFEKDGE